MRRIICLFIAFALLFSMSTLAFAAKEEQQFFFDTIEKTDKNYVKNGSIDAKNPHHGWKLGRFVISDFTRKTDKDGKAVFLKNVGDKITFSFNLLQDIDALNKDQTKSIASVQNGFDENYDFSEASFGRGLLLVKHTDYQGKSKVTPYKNFLSGVKVGANTKIELLEEGDYEVSLDYCISDGKAPFGLDRVGSHKIVPSYDYYRIHFSFSIRNGNCMVYPFDVVTKNELTNSAFTENGFYLDLAKSRYLHIDVKKQVLNTGKDGLTEDTRFNRPSYDGAEFTDEGIYLITVSNQYTNSQTTKTIYVGTNKVLKAYATYAPVGKSLQEINMLVEKGATINDDGTINEVVEEIPSITINDTSNSLNEPVSSNGSIDRLTEEGSTMTGIIIGAITLVIIIIIVVYPRKKKKIPTTSILIESKEK